MALLKDIKLKNGITVKYHRVSDVTLEVNKYVKVTVFSYLSKEERDKELEYERLSKRMRSYEELTPEELKFVNSYSQTFIEEDTIVLEYNSSIDITNIYEALKNNEKYKDAEDV